MQTAIDRRRWLAGVVALALGAPRAHAAATFEVDDLLRLLARTAHARARFTERRWLAVLDRPIDASGDLAFDAPAHFVKRTTSPKHETLTIDGDAVRVERDGRHWSADLASLPELAAVIDALRGALTGDRAALERTFAIAPGGSLDAWSLALLPSDPRVAQTIAHVRITGSRGVVRSVEVVQADGDRALTTLEATRAE